MPTKTWAWHPRSSPSWWRLARSLPVSDGKADQDRESGIPPRRGRSARDAPRDGSGHLAGRRNPSAGLFVVAVQGGPSMLRDEVNEDAGGRGQLRDEANEGRGPVAGMGRHAGHVGAEQCRQHEPIVDSEMGCVIRRKRTGADLGAAGRWQRGGRALGRPSLSLVGPASACRSPGIRPRPARPGYRRDSASGFRSTTPTATVFSLTDGLGVPYDSVASRPSRGETSRDLRTPIHGDLPPTARPASAGPRPYCGRAGS